MIISINKKLAHFLLIVFGVLVFVLSNISTENKKTVFISKENSPDRTTSITPTPTLYQEGALKKVVEEQMKGAKGKYAIVVKNLRTGESYASLEHEKFESASLYKLWIMAVSFERINKGDLRKEQVLTDDIAKLNETFKIASEAAELTEGTVSFTVENALRQMITLSDNYAALLLSKTIRLSSVTEFLKRNSFRESKIGQPPQTTAFDIALFYEKLYRGELADQKDTNYMLALLKAQKLNNKIPRFLPEGTIVAHKTGELGTFSHDAGIVFGEENDYLIVVLSESNAPGGAEERIANLSSAVYHFFNN